LTTSWDGATSQNVNESLRIFPFSKNTKLQLVTPHNGVYYGVASNAKTKELISMPATQTVTPSETFACAESHEPNEETIAALIEAEDLDSLTECSDLRDMLVKCGLNR
jgi:S-adenosylmethionine hydrolase